MPRAVIMSPRRSVAASPIMTVTALTTRSSLAGLDHLISGVETRCEREDEHEAVGRSTRSERVRESTVGSK